MAVKATYPWAMDGNIAAMEADLALGPAPAVAHPAAIAAMRHADELLVHTTRREGPCFSGQLRTPSSRIGVVTVDIPATSDDESPSKSIPRGVSADIAP